MFFLIKKKGLFGMALTFIILAAMHGADGVPLALTLVVFGAMKSCDAFGPGMATYVIPAEIFPTAARATAHGLSAASGKIGAALGSMAFALLVDVDGVPGVFVACAITCLLTIVCAVVLLPTYNDAKLDVLAESEHGAEMTSASWLRFLYAFSSDGAREEAARAHERWWGTRCCWWCLHIVGVAPPASVVGAAARPAFGDAIGAGLADLDAARFASEQHFADGESDLVEVELARFGGGSLWGIDRELVGE